MVVNVQLAASLLFAHIMFDFLDDLVWPRFPVEGGQPGTLAGIGHAEAEHADRFVAHHQFYKVVGQLPEYFPDRALQIKQIVGDIGSDAFVFNDGGEQVFFAAKVAIDCLLGNTGVDGYLVHTGAVETAL